MLKRAEKSRDSITDGVPLQLPALTLYSKLRRKSLSLGLQLDGPDVLRGRASELISLMDVPSEMVSDAALQSENDDLWAELLGALGDLARWSGVDLEATLRRRSLQLREEIRARESAAEENPSKLTS